MPVQLARNGPIYLCLTLIRCVDVSLADGAYSSSDSRLVTNVDLLNEAYVITPAQVTCSSVLTKLGREIGRLSYLCLF
jgi:hypothetical protein